MSVVLSFSENWTTIAEDKAVQLLGCIHDLEVRQSMLDSVKYLDTWTAALKDLTDYSWSTICVCAPYFILPRSKVST